ncbi:uncharacterized protein LOC116428351 isoform X1 [Nomia melanderi]|uniref:uncharacterized protein LOC116428351 isoform X1 n=1 Tax=Nomia melanderi TaxID=2448451 RepID=UPI0013041B5E|nr:uncharacterized protein LOC116428351 isoform X1 [Nomia melanderi]
MLVSFIPFFLVAHVAVDETVWKLGPEFVFDVEMNFTSIPMDHHLQTVKKSNYTVMNLYCRPKRDDTLALSCRMANCRGQSIDLTNDNQLEMSEETYKRFCDAEPFEIKYNEHGIDHLIVNERMRVYTLNDIKLIAERLNIGVDLNGIPDGTFDVPQNTTIGRCNVHVGLHHYPTKRVLNNVEKYRYELKALPPLNKVPGEVLLIQKTTNLNNCSRYAAFYFGSYGNSLVEPDLHSHLESSTSRIFISDFQFASTLSRTGTLGSDRMNNLVAISEYVSVTLREIRAAKRELPDITEASRTDIEVNANVNRINAMK